ncbi:MAG: TetR/AcrR family transcriptional regulator [Allosphingosinicella sp.]
MVQKSGARGRPRSFDTDQVLASVRDTFWRYGYAGTSMDQLSSATGLHKPSLYGAFGDKRRLYLATLDRYLAEVRSQFGAAFAQPKLLDCLTEIAARAIVMFTRDGPKGCFMMATAVPEAGDDPEITKVVRAAMEELDRALTRRFRQGIEAGELPESADPAALAMIVAAHHYDLSARARAGYSMVELQGLAGRSLALVKQIGGFEDED